jgi:hypothetical protein
VPHRIGAGQPDLAVALQTGRLERGLPDPLAPVREVQVNGAAARAAARVDGPEQRRIDPRGQIVERGERPIRQTRSSVGACLTTIPAPTTGLGLPRRNTSARNPARRRRATASRWVSPTTEGGVCASIVEQKVAMLLVLAIPGPCDPDLAPPFLEEPPHPDTSAPATTTATTRLRTLRTLAPRSPTT